MWMGAQGFPHGATDRCSQQTEVDVGHLSKPQLVGWVGARWIETQKPSNTLSNNDNKACGGGGEHGLRRVHTKNTTTYCYSLKTKIRSIGRGGIGRVHTHNSAPLPKHGTQTSLHNLQET